MFNLSYTRMNRFTISQLSHLSGISSFTIRTWEARYHAFAPERSKGRQRFYDGEQLRRLLNIVSLKDSGEKVSVLCSLPDHSLFQLIQQRWALNERKASNFYLSQMIAAGFSYDDEGFTRLLKRCLDRMGVKNAYLTVLYPLQLRIGLLWRSNAMEIGHEHFIISLLRQKLHAEIDRLPVASRPDDSWLLFLPEGEYHEMGLMVAHYLIRSTGRRAFYLGPSIAFSALAKACHDLQPDNLLFFRVSMLAKGNDNYLKDLGRHFSGRHIYAAGAYAGASGIPEARLRLLNNLEDLHLLL